MVMKFGLVTNVTASCINNCNYSKEIKYIIQIADALPVDLPCSPPCYLKTPHNSIDIEISENLQLVHASLPANKIHNW